MHSARLLLALAAVLAGCAGEPAPTSPAPAPSQSGGAAVTDLASPLTALPECPSAPAGKGEKVEGLVLPPGSIVSGVTRQDPLVTVTAFVPMTPVQLEAAYPAMAGITVLVTENEIYEAELLISNGSHRNFIKATATCSTGSKVMAVVAPEVDADGLPLPQGAAATPGPSS